MNDKHYIDRRLEITSSYRAEVLLVVKDHRTANRINRVLAYYTKMLKFG